MSSSLAGTLLTGTLSPVNMLSFRMASPERRNRSAGTKVNAELDKLTTSPGTKSVELRSCPVVYENRDQSVANGNLHAPSTRTSILQEKRDISLMRAMVFITVNLYHIQTRKPEPFLSQVE